MPKHMRVPTACIVCPIETDCAHAVRSMKVTVNSKRISDKCPLMNRDEYGVADWDDMDWLSNPYSEEDEYVRED